jgi:hypothetical protein
MLPASGRRLLADACRQRTGCSVARIAAHHLGRAEAELRPCRSGLQPDAHGVVAGADHGGVADARDALELVDDD